MGIDMEYPMNELFENKKSYTWSEWAMAIAQSISKNGDLPSSEFHAADRIVKIATEVADKMIEKQQERS